MFSHEIFIFERMNTMKKIIAALLSVATLMTAAVSVSAITKSDKPITGGNTLFTQKEIMYTGEPDAASPWSNAFCNEDWTGCRWTAEKKDGIDCVKVVPVAGKTKNYMDFNYYQWNNDKYYPSLDCSQYKYLKVKYMLNESAAKTAGDSTFWASQDSPELSKTAGTGSIDYKMPDEANKWQEVIVDLSGLKLGDTAWSETTIRQFRYYPFGKNAVNADAECYIEYIAFFKTEAEAKAFTNKKAAEKPSSAAKTADPIALVILAASASMGLAFTASRKH